MKTTHEITEKGLLGLLKSGIDKILQGLPAQQTD
jgi:hypothetical protein